VIGILVRNWRDFASGMFVTLELAVVVWFVGLVLGAPLGAFRASLRGRAEAAASVVFLGLGSIPILVYLFWFHYPVQKALNIVLDPFYTSCFVLGLFNALIVSDVVRSAVADFPSDYALVAVVNGVSRRDFWIEVQAPLVLIAILPAYISTQVTALHTTLFASLISVNELFRQAQTINSREYRPVEIYSLLVIFYFALCFPLLMLSRWLQRRYGGYRA
jgi:His/Glu/Gln/Arg/opine family amino acid ABC transporter permease subunit